MPPKGFKCRICQCTSYAVVQVKRPDGHFRDTPLFECSQCSVVFHDPVAFTEGAIGFAERRTFLNMRRNQDD